MLALYISICRWDSVWIKEVSFVLEVVLYTSLCSYIGVKVEGVLIKEVTFFRGLQ